MTRAESDEKARASAFYINAIAWLERGFSVFPCRQTDEIVRDDDGGVIAIKGAKSPLTPNGLHDAISPADAATRESRLLAWARNYPNALVGLPTGKAAGAFVLDIDVRGESHKDDGVATLHALEARHGDLPPTFTVETPSGGRHLYFLHVAGIGNSAGKLGAGLDSRGDGGFVIAADSVLADGGRYRVVNDAAFATPPDWLIKELQSAHKAEVKRASRLRRRECAGTTAYGRAALDGIVNELASAGEGRRGTELNRLAFKAGRLVGANEIEFDEAVAAAVYACGRNGLVVKDRLGLVERNASRAVEDGTKWPAEIKDRQDLPTRNLSKLGSSRLKSDDRDIQPPLADEPEFPRMIDPSKEWLGNPPPRDWYIDGWIPMRNVTLIYGDGGHGKSLLAQQIGMGGSLNQYVLGLEPRAGRVLYVAGEDEKEEVWRRAFDIVRCFGKTMADLKDFRVLPFAGIDSYLCQPDRNGGMAPTRVWDSVQDDIADFRPTLVVYDTAANLFGGDEIKKAQVVQFVEMIKREAIASNHAAILLAHPSTAGINDGSGMGGSRAWSNSARSRLYMVKGDDSIYRLTNKKMNYAATGDELAFRWQDGAFSLMESAGKGITKALAVEKKFMELLDDNHKMGSPPSPNINAPRTYAPRMFSRSPEGKHFSEDDYTKAMKSLLAEKQIVIAAYRNGGHERNQLVRPTPWNDRLDS